VYENFIRRR